jgi:hypothetical protein
MQLKHLSNQELENQLQRLVRQERKLLHLIVEHIREVESRKLYLEKAYSSLYEYLTKELGYSSSSAQRRIEAARLSKVIPELSVKIESGVVNLSQIGEFSRAIKQKEKESGLRIQPQVKQELLAKIENQSTFATQRILSQELDITLKPVERTQIQKDESVSLQLTLSKVQHAKLLKCKDLAAHILLQNHKSTQLSEVVDVLMDSYLKENTVVTKNNVSTQDRKESKSNACVSNEDAARSVDDANPAVSSTAATATLRVNKSLTPKVRKEILNANPCCQYQDPQTQKICGSSFALEIEHIQPQWAEGSHDRKNLSVLCSQHNKLKYRQQTQIRFL